MSVIVINVKSQLIDVSCDLQLPTDHTGGLLGTGVSYADFNNDDIDDLTFGHHAGQLRFFQGFIDETGAGFQEVTLNISNSQSEAKAVLWADIDNDGDQDFLVTNRIAPNKLWRNDGGMQFTDISEFSEISQDNTKSYGASFGDFNNDGFIDLYICNYHTNVDFFTNELYQNNGNGTFTNVTVIAGVGNGLAQSLQSTFIDINQDGHLDLHVINDRVDCPNVFYKNNGDGTFTDMAMIWGVNLTILAMSSSFGDYDRDGDMDLYVSNGSNGNSLLRNDLKTIDLFVEVSAQENVEVGQICWGASWFDHNNDTWPDLYVASGTSAYTEVPDVFDDYGYQPNQFFVNQGTPPMINASSSTPLNDQFSFAVATGDYNNDGFPDIVSHQIGAHAIVLAGTPNDNHYLKIRPQGVTVNRDAIGAIIEVFHSGGVEMNVVFCGDKYLAQNSRHLHFGLGTSAQIDSVVVQWPGGEGEVFTGIAIDTSIVLIEGSSLDGGTNDECPDPWSFCGIGTIWDEASETCISIFTEDVCPSDLNNDGITNVPDLLELLINFGTICTD
ncbi:MAG: CRTAC1 family protein [Flavobacteriales bacterium]|nr:CRTAC1 family protein [Flavobacteriales bacterium]MBT6173999.1 CRTAC1 family protein [Flavobacteriales bacterium]